MLNINNIENVDDYIYTVKSNRSFDKDEDDDNDNDMKYSWFEIDNYQLVNEDKKNIGLLFNKKETNSYYLIGTLQPKSISNSKPLQIMFPVKCYYINFTISPLRGYWLLGNANQFVRILNANSIYKSFLSSAKYKIDRLLKLYDTFQNYGLLKTSINEFIPSFNNNENENLIEKIHQESMLTTNMIKLNTAIDIDNIQTTKVNIESFSLEFVKENFRFIIDELHDKINENCLKFVETSIYNYANKINTNTSEIFIGTIHSDFQCEISNFQNKSDNQESYDMHLKSTYHLENIKKSLLSTKQKNNNYSETINYDSNSENSKIESDFHINHYKKHQQQLQKINQPPKCVSESSESESDSHTNQLYQLEEQVKKRGRPPKTKVNYNFNCKYCSKFYSSSESKFVHEMQYCPIKIQQEKESKIDNEIGNELKHILNPEYESDNKSIEDNIHKQQVNSNKLSLEASEIGNNETQEHKYYEENFDTDTEKNIPKKKKAKLTEEDMYQCQYCSKSLHSLQNFLEHQLCLCNKKIYNNIGEKRSCKISKIDSAKIVETHDDSHLIVLNRKNSKSKKVYNEKLSQNNTNLFSSISNHRSESKTQKPKISPRNFIKDDLIESLINKSNDRLSPNTISFIQTTPSTKKKKIKWADSIEGGNLRHFHTAPYEYTALEIVK